MTSELRAKIDQAWSDPDLHLMTLSRSDLFEAGVNLALSLKPEPGSEEADMELAKAYVESTDFIKHESRKK